MGKQLLHRNYGQPCISGMFAKLEKDFGRSYQGGPPVRRLHTVGNTVPLHAINRNRDSPGGKRAYNTHVRRQNMTISQRLDLPGGFVIYYGLGILRSLP